MILYNANEDVSDWVAKQLFNVDRGYFGDCTAIGNVHSGKLIAGVVYNNFKVFPDNRPHSIEMNIATIDKRWASKAYLKAIFRYPFIQLCLERVQIVTSIHNEGINSVVSRLGFKKEGKHPKAGALGDDAFSWGMLKHQCRWL